MLCKSAHHLKSTDEIDELFCPTSSGPMAGRGLPGGATPSDLRRVLRSAPRGRQDVVAGLTQSRPTPFGPRYRHRYGRHHPDRDPGSAGVRARSPGRGLCRLDTAASSVGIFIAWARAVSRVGNATLRRALYLPALAAVRFNPLVKGLSDRLAAQGRLKPKQIIAAAMRKLLHLCYGVLKTGKPFDPTHRLALRAGA